MSKDIAILVVDDEKELAEIIVDDILDAGYSNVFMANSMAEAIEVIGNKSIKVVITDLRMPHGTGLDLLEKIFSTKTTVQGVCFMSGFSDCSEIEAYDRGAAGIVEKPIKIQLLLKRIEVLCLGFDALLVEKNNIVLNSPNITKAGVNLMNGDTKLKLGKFGFSINLIKSTLKINDPLSFRIEFTKPQSFVLEGNGTVRWVAQEPESDQSFLGIEFAQLVSTDDIYVLKKFLEDSKVRSYIPILKE